MQRALTERTHAPAQYQALFVCVSPTLQPALNAVLQKLAEKHPKATPPQLADEVMAAGILHLVKAFGITVPR